MSLKIRKLSPELQKIAIEELNEVPDQIPLILEQFREWIRQSPHLKVNADDQFLITFLRGCKYSLERAKHKLDMFYTVRSHAPGIFANRDPLDEMSREILKLGIIVPLPTSISDGSRIFITRLGAYSAEKYTLEEVMRGSSMIADTVLVEDDRSIIAGVTFLVDLKGLTLAHILQMQPSVLKKLTVIWQERPSRPKGLHYVNTPPAFEQIFKIFKGFLKDKLKSRIFVHGSDMESLYRHLPRRVLPAEYGGECGSINDVIAEWERKVISRREIILKENSYGVDETKRIGEPKNPETLFGIDGTFRKLEID